jgi:hypothetical protein
MYIKNSPSP